jgi:phage-related protein
MIEIKDLLSRFENLLLNEDFKKGAIVSVLKDVLKIDIEKEKITIIKGDIYLDINPIYKNEIFIKKEKIISKILELIPSKNLDIK